MKKLGRFTMCVCGLSIMMSQAIHPQKNGKREVVVPGDSGIKAVKSAWFKHVARIPGTSIPPPATATMGVPANSSIPPSPGGFGGSRRGFMYETTFKNESIRKMADFHWDHVFLDPKDGSEVQRFHFQSYYEPIGKGKTLTFRRFSTEPPSGTVDISMLEKGAPPYLVRIDIKCVLFDGNVFWRSADATVDECAYLKQRFDRAK